ncbi:MAG: hypothetical protein ABJN34_06045 [Litoreibacter sp.]
MNDIFAGPIPKIRLYAFQEIHMPDHQTTLQAEEDARNDAILIYVDGQAK